MIRIISRESLHLLKSSNLCACNTPIQSGIMGIRPDWQTVWTSFYKSKTCYAYYYYQEHLRLSVPVATMQIHQSLKIPRKCNSRQMLFPIR